MKCKICFNELERVPIRGYSNYIHYKPCKHCSETFKKQQEYYDNNEEFCDKITCIIL